MIQRLRRLIARVVATVITVLTLGLVHVNPSGELRTSAGRDATAISRIVKQDPQAPGP